MSLDSVQPPHLNFDTFQAILGLIMCADPTPLSKEDDEKVTDWADAVSQVFGFTGWIDAFHHKSISQAGE